MQTFPEISPNFDNDIDGMTFCWCTYSSYGIAGYTDPH